MVNIEYESSLSALEEENGHLTQVEIDKMSCFVRYIASKVTSYNAMPRRIVLFIEFFFNKGCNILKERIKF